VRPLDTAAVPTIARRYVEDHPGALNCDIDVLRTLIGGWSTDFLKAGSLIRPAALAMIEGYLGNGEDVVLPQLLIDPAEIALFEACAVRANAQFVELLLMDDPERSIARFKSRASDDSNDPWHSQVQTIVAAQGGDDALRTWHSALEALTDQRPDMTVVESSEGDIEVTYQRVLASLPGEARKLRPG
jgi:hypothetical protein